MSARLVHRKDSKHLRDYFMLSRLLERVPSTVVEFGVDRGGSLLLWYDMWRPRVLIGFDINIAAMAEEPLISVEGRASAAEDRPIKAYGADQKDPLLPNRMRGVGIGLGSVDLLIDDASHSGADSLALFKSCWAFVRPGGAHVVEDWEGGTTMRDFILDQIKVGWREMDLESPLVGPTGTHDLRWVFAGQSLVAFGKGTV